MRALLFPSVLLSASVALAAPEGDYNMPEAKTVAKASDLSPMLMEKAATPEALADFKAKHPADFWLFGERRDRAVRTNVFPAVWLGEGAGALGGFRGKAQPGEYYVFQVAIVGGAKAPAETIAWEAKRVGCPVLRLFRSLPKIDALSLGGTDMLGKPMDKRLPWPKEGEVKPLWFGVQVPKEAEGELAFALEIGGKAFPVTLEVAGEPLADGGIHDGWRLARMKWLNSTIAQSDTEVTAPFTPIAVDAAKRTLGILGRTVTLGADGLPKQYRSFFNGSNTKILPEGREAFVEAPAFTLGGKALQAKSFAFTRTTPVGVDWEAVSVTADGALTLTVQGALEFDGHMNVRMTVRAARDAAYDGAALTFALAPEASRFAMGLGLQGGNAPETLDWKWNVANHQDALWVGGVNQGLMLRLKGANYHRPLINAYYDFRPLALPESWGTGGVTLRKGKDATHLAFTGGKASLKAGETMVYDSDWYLTPFKTIDPATHFANRYYHGHQGRGLEDFKQLTGEGHNVFNIHHNRPTNPFINYPYNDLSIGALKEQVKAAHAAGAKLKVYYTTREVTQNMPEFFALQSLDGEVILPRRQGVKWPVTNRNGPHPWLKAHAGEDIVPAWRETIRYPEYKGMLDLAVITTPDTRWNNFYLEGLDYLVKEVGIDGLYIDDTALDRKSMQRARRILDQNGPGKRLVDMHSWNHYNGLAKWANSDICFMELYPYYDSLWHGEGAFTMNRSPDFILTEMSGLCYGLMSEQLSDRNLWRGMVYGMLVRRPWSGDPRPAWRLIDAFGMVPGTDMIGWWDPANPVRPGHPDALATLYRRPDGKTLLAIANFGKGKDPIATKLNIDWKALGIDPAKAKWVATPSQGFQEAATFAPGDDIPLAPGRGWLLTLCPVNRE